MDNNPSKHIVTIFRFDVECIFGDKIVEVERQIIVPIEVPIPVDRFVEKVVHIERDVEKIVQVPQTIEKIVEVKVESVTVEKVVEKISVPVFREEIREIERVVPYVQTEIR